MTAACRRLGGPTMEEDLRPEVLGALLVVHGVCALMLVERLAR